MTLDTFILDDNSHLILKKDNNTIKFLIRQPGARSYEKFSVDVSQLLKLSNIFTDIVKEYNNDIVGNIVLMVSYGTGIPVSSIIGKSRKGPIVMARHITRYFSCKYYNPTQLSKIMNCHHVTMLNSLKVINNILQTKFPNEYYNWILKVKTLLYEN